MKTLNYYMCLLLMAVYLLVSVQVQAQITNPKEVARQKTEERTNNKIDEGIDSGLNKIEEGIGNLFRKKEKNREIEEVEEEEIIEAEEDVMEEEQVEQSRKSFPMIEKTPLISTTQYDFVPGDQVLYYEDFSQDAIGDFPANWASNTSGEVKTLNIAPGNWLHMDAGGGTYTPLVTIDFPENFIFEFDLIPNSEYDEFEFTLYEEDSDRELNNDLFPGKDGLQIWPNSEYAGGWFVRGYQVDKDWLQGNSEKYPIIKETVNHIIIWMQKRRVRVYHRGAKIIDIPLSVYPDTKFNRFRFFCMGIEETKPYVSNIKITTASPDTRSKLLTEGKMITYGIPFDVNKADIKSESYGTLKSIADVLKENSGLKIKIIGHTDSDGDDAMNVDLSKRRAESVKNELSKTFGIELNRMETEGAGEKIPLAPNDTAENKARNRRVELIKI